MLIADCSIADCKAGSAFAAIDNQQCALFFEILEASVGSANRRNEIIS
jgi:hypothetical protein